MLRVKETARELGVAESTIRSWTKSGFLPDRRDRNNRRYFLEEDVVRAKDKFYGRPCKKPLADKG